MLLQFYVARYSSVRVLVGSMSCCESISLREGGKGEGGGSALVCVSVGHSLIC